MTSPSTPALLATPVTATGGAADATTLVELNNKLRAALSAARDRLAADRATAAAL
jgi:hypothetical protein